MITIAREFCPIHFDKLDKIHIKDHGYIAYSCKKCMQLCNENAHDFYHAGKKYPLKRGIIIYQESFYLNNEFLQIHYNESSAVLIITPNTTPIKKYYTAHLIDLSKLFKNLKGKSALIVSLEEEMSKDIYWNENYI